MHARTGYEDWPEPERRRDLCRLWIVIAEELGLPEGVCEQAGLYLAQLP